MRDDIFPIRMSSFLHSARVGATVKRDIVLQGLISVRVYSMLRFNIVEEKMCETRRGCLSRVITCVCVLLQGIN